MRWQPIASPDLLLPPPKKATARRGGAGHGEALILVGATCWVFYTLGAAEFPGWSALRYTTLTCALGVSSVAVVECIAVKVGFVALPSPATLLQAAPDFFYLVLVASVMGLLFWNAGMQAVGPARGVLFINLVPVTAFTIAVMGGRVPSGAEVAGVALVIGALVLNSFRPTARAISVLTKRKSSVSGRSPLSL
jgi:drug/metabolite transporter (DMT)-like permease